MEKTTKRKAKNGIGRVFLFAVAILLQLAWMVVLLIKLDEHSQIASVVVSMLEMVVALFLFGKRMNSAFKFPWLILLVAFPVFGLILYFATGHSTVTRRKCRKFRIAWEKVCEAVTYDPDTILNLEKINPGLANQARYIENKAGYQAFSSGDVKFYGNPCDQLEQMLIDIKNAKRFIFMEYHAIEESTSFSRVCSLLSEKSSEGVEVRLIYDDVGSIGFINFDFVGRMKEAGVNCRVFNPLMPFLDVFMNNRDHRKITVIDGRVGFTGGFNLADEYFNIVNPYGIWKDSGVRIVGDPVRNLTESFLEMWNGIDFCDNNMDKYLIPSDNIVPSAQVKESRLIQPFGDSPLDNENVGENVYLNLINNAQNYIWFTTPYLIVDEETERALILAAGKGIDVRIVIPGIPDKKLIYKATRSYCNELASHGVRIFVYKPGFIHSKQCVCDGIDAVCGTINIDYRSFYLHFENAVLLSGVQAVDEIIDDFTDIFADCEEITDKCSLERNPFREAYENILRLLSPLM